MGNELRAVIEASSLEMTAAFDVLGNTGGGEAFDGSAILAMGERFPRSGYRTGIWRFAADGSDAAAGGGVDLLAGSELKPDTAMNSDVTIGGEPAIAYAFRAALSRSPAPAELEKLWALLQSRELEAGSDETRRAAALADICQLMLCMNEFVYID